MYRSNYSIRLLKIGGSGKQLKLSLGKDACDHLRVMRGDSIRWWLYRDRHLVLKRSECEEDEELMPTTEPLSPMGRVSRVEMRATYRRATIPSVFCRLLNLSVNDYLACRPIQDYAFHAWPVTNNDLAALDPLYNPESHNT